MSRLKEYFVGFALWCVTVGLFYVALYMLLHILYGM